MDDLNSTLASILGDPGKMEQLRQLAQSLGLNTGGGESPASQSQGFSGQGSGQGTGGFDPSMIASVFQNLNAGGSAAPQNTSGSDGSSDGAGPLGNLGKLAGVMSAFNSQGDKNVQLLRSLKPHFSPARASRVDDAVRIMMLMKAWPTLRDSGLLGSLGNLFGGGNGK